MDTSSSFSALLSSLVIVSATLVSSTSVGMTVTADDDIGGTVVKYRLHLPELCCCWWLRNDRVDKVEASNISNVGITTEAKDTVASVKCLRRRIGRECG